MKPTIFIIIYLIMIISSFTSIAQNQIKSGVVGSGGGIMESSNHKIIGTVGQPAIGISTSQSNQLISGFWYDVFVPTGANEENSLLPAEFRLEQNFPNPFNPTTTIQFGLPKSSHVKLEVFDVTGQRIRLLVNEEKPAGHYQIKFDAASLSSGIYFYRIETGTFKQINKMILLR